MSWYYQYYVGYRLDGKIYPWGPYTAKGKLKPLIDRSRSFASDLHQEFYCVNQDAITDELRDAFSWKDAGGEVIMPSVKYLPVSDLPSKSYIKTGYFLIKDVMAYENDEYGDFDGFYDVLSPAVYAAKLQHEMTFGKNTPTKDCEGEEYTEPNASDYMYYAYPDTHSEEYEAHLLRNLVEALREYDTPTGLEYVILETEG